MHRLTMTHALELRRWRGTRGRGAVYQGRYRASLVATKRISTGLSRYVERNPVRATLVERADDWLWSSASPIGMHPGSQARANGQLPRPADWRAFVNEVEPPASSDCQEAHAPAREPHRRSRSPSWKRLPTGRSTRRRPLTRTDRMRSTGAQNPPARRDFRPSPADASGEAPGAAREMSDSLLGMRGVNGLHHVTAISGPAQENLDFYAGVLGMRLVKRSVNQDDPGTYHLFYADAEGHAGTDLTFFPWAHMAPSRDGPRARAPRSSLAVPAGSLDWWGERLTALRRAPSRAIETRFGERALPLVDPHGLRVALVETPRRRRPRLHAVGGQPGAGRAPDPRPARRPRRRARSRGDRRVPHRGPRLRRRTPPRATGSASWSAGGGSGRHLDVRGGAARRRVAARGAPAASTTSPGASTTTRTSSRCAAQRRRAPARTRRR